MDSYKVNASWCKFAKPELAHGLAKGLFTLAVFAAISSAISNRPYKLLAIQIAAESPVVYRKIVRVKVIFRKTVVGD